MAAAIAAAWPSRCSIQGDLGRGEAFEIGTGDHPAVLKSHKTRQGASRNPIKPLPQQSYGQRQPKSHKTTAAAWLKPAAAQSKEILGAGRPLRLGQGAIRQF